MTLAHSLPLRATALLLLLAALPGAFPAQAADKGRRDPYRALRLPSDRADALKNLQSRVDRENRWLKGRLEERRSDLDELYRSDRYNESRCQALRRETRDLRNQLLELHHRFQVELRVILREGEFAQLQREIRRARRRGNDDD